MARRVTSVERVKKEAPARRRVSCLRVRGVGVVVVVVADGGDVWGWSAIGWGGAWARAFGGV